MTTSPAIPSAARVQPMIGSQVDLNRIARSSSMSEAEKAAELSKEFEAMLLKQVMKGLQNSLGGSSMFPSKGPSSVYGDMMMDALTHSISRASQLGISDMVQRQVSQQAPEASSAKPAPTTTESTKEAKEKQ